MFLTGAAGTGNSFIIGAISERLMKQGKHVRVVAWTGMATQHVNGQTFHSFFGWPSQSKATIDTMADAHVTGVSDRLCHTDALIVDEISMVERDYFTRMDHCLREANRGRRADLQTEPFGGLQIIVVGDFYQLPPILPFACCITCGEPTRKVHNHGFGQIHHHCIEHGPTADGQKWAFQSVSWQHCHFVNINLTEIHRQHDPGFRTVLNNRRLGHPMTDDERHVLLRHQTNNLEPVDVLSRNEDVDLVNRTRLQDCTGPELSFHSLDSYR